MKKKLYLIFGLAFMALQVLPVADAFADLPPYAPDEAKGEHLDEKDYYLNYYSKGIKLLERPLITLSVNGMKNDRISSGESLVFVASVANDERLPAPTAVTFSYTAEGILHTNSVPVTNKKATFTLNYSDLPSDPSVEYTMTAAYTENGIEVKDQVQFGVLGENVTIIFTEPGVGGVASINDPIHFKVKTFRGIDSQNLVISWNCANYLSNAYTCPSQSVEETDLAFNAVGTYNVTVTVTDQNNNKDTETITIKVIDDLPYVSAFTLQDEFEPGAEATAHVVTSDLFGTVNKLEWGCGDDNNIIFDHQYIYDLPRKAARHEITTQLPDAEGDIHHCMFRATDDDGQVSESYDLVFKTRKPVVEPENPIDPVDPVDPVEPVDPVDPVEPVTPSKPDTGVFSGNDASAAADLALAATSSLGLISLIIVARRSLKNKQ